GLDRRRPLRGPRRAGRELRPGRPGGRAHGRGARDASRPRAGARRPAAAPRARGLTVGPRALAATLLQRGWERASRLGTVHAGSRRARAFGRFGEGSVIAFPITVLYGERWIWIGEGTRIGPNLSLSVGMAPQQVPVSD